MKPYSTLPEPGRNHGSHATDSRHIRNFLCGQIGASLVEMTVALAVAAILAAAGLPQLGVLLRREAAEQQGLAWRSALRLARNEAIRLGETVTLCARDPTGADTVHICASGASSVGAGADWSAGWLVFIDQGRRGVLEEGDRVLRVHQPTGALVHITSSMARVSFQSSGVSFSAAANIRFVPLGEAPDGPGAVLVCINKAGRARVSSSAQACS